MSQETVEVVRGSFEAWNAGDMDAWSSFLAPDVVWRPPPDSPEPGPFTGREAVLRQVQQTARRGTPTQRNRSVTSSTPLIAWSCDSCGVAEATGLHTTCR